MATEAAQKVRGSMPFAAVMSLFVWLALLFMPPTFPGGNGGRDSDPKCRPPRSGTLVRPYEKGPGMAKSRSTRLTEPRSSDTVHAHCAERSRDALPARTWTLPARRRRPRRASTRRAARGTRSRPRSASAVDSGAKVRGCRRRARVAPTALQLRGVIDPTRSPERRRLSWRSGSSLGVFSLRSSETHSASREAHNRHPESAAAIRHDRTCPRPRRNSLDFRRRHRPGPGR
jgi:hypothetical protein